MTYRHSRYNSPSLIHYKEMNAFNHFETNKVLSTFAELKRNLEFGRRLDLKVTTS